MVAQDMHAAGDIAGVTVRQLIVDIEFGMLVEIA